MALIEGWFDGVCEDINPGGHAAWGALLKIDSAKAWESSGYCGVGPEMSNNLAEYSGVLELLHKIADLQSAGLRGPVIIRGDSKLVIMQLQRKWKVHGGLYVPVYESAVKMLTVVSGMAGGNVKFEWIPRDKNSECDVLSKGELHKRGVKFRIQPEASPKPVEGTHSDQQKTGSAKAE